MDWSSYKQLLLRVGKLRFQINLLRFIPGGRCVVVSVGVGLEVDDKGVQSTFGDMTMTRTIRIMKM